MDLAAVTDWTTLCALVLVLGMRHGFDADHLATIDGLTRFNMRRRPLLARYCGTLFSLGHGVVVVAIATAVSVASTAWEVPRWMDSFGAAVSIGFLLALGIANLHAVFATPADSMVQPVGFKGRWLGRFNQTSHPALVALVGALFALSFDTLSQAALFAVVAVHFGGMAQTLQLALIFLAGMLLVDGVNGLWISRLLRRADDVALIASRIMGLAVAGISLLVAGFAIARINLPDVAAWSDGKEVAFGAAILLLLAGSFLFATRRPRPIASP